MKYLALVVALAACGSQAPVANEPAPGGGIELFVSVIEGAEPAIVLEAGGGADSTSWQDLPAAIARGTGRKVIAYDRAGFGHTALPSGAFTVDDELDALHEKLQAIGVSHVVFVAESYGGMLAVAYSLRFPENVSGLVLLDPMNADFVNTVGLAKVTSTAPKIDSPRTDKERALAHMVSVFPGLVTSLASKRWAASIPTVIVTAGIPWWPDESMREPWRTSHETLASDTGARLVVAERSQHDIATTQPELVVAQVRLVLVAH